MVSTQHSDDVKKKTLEEAIRTHVINWALPKELVTAKTKFWINPTGRFVTGGPMGDAGLTGRKIIVDTYGGMARHGGGAFELAGSEKRAFDLVTGGENIERRIAQSPPACGTGVR